MAINSEEYDVVILGSSPLAITEALFQKKSGKKVVVIDEAPKIGGAWKSIDYQELPEIELGCHIWDVEKRVTSFLNQYYSLNLQPLKPKPKIYYKGFSFPYDWKCA